MTNVNENAEMIHQTALNEVGFMVRLLSGVYLTNDRGPKKMQYRQKLSTSKGELELIVSARREPDVQHCKGQTIFHLFICSDKHGGIASASQSVLKTDEQSLHYYAGEIAADVNRQLEDFLKLVEPPSLWSRFCAWWEQGGLSSRPTSDSAEPAGI